MKEITCFKPDLINHLKTIKSEKANDPEFILQRCEKAKATYVYYTNQGFSEKIALDEAIRILFEGLSYSRYNILQKVIENEHPEITEDQINNLVKTILPYCTSVFEQYTEVSDKTPYFEQLYSELAKIVSIFFED